MLTIETYFDNLKTIMTDLVLNETSRGAFDIKPLINASNIYVGISRSAFVWKKF